MCYDQEKTQGAPSLAERQQFEQVERELKRHKDAYANQSEIAGQLSRPMSDKEILAELFSYHPPTPLTLPKFAAINQAAKNFAEVVLQICPSSADRSAAIRLIRDARMTANASVALNGLNL
jgi:hypothetical protein